MNYLFALMHCDGHAEGQVIDPVSGRCVLGLNFPGAGPVKTPDHFEAQGAIVVPIKAASMVALRDMMDQLKLLSGTHRQVEVNNPDRPQDAHISDDIRPSMDKQVDQVVAALEKLVLLYPQQAQALGALMQQLNASMDRVENDPHFSLLDDALALPEQLRELAVRVRPESPELAAALVEGEESVLGCYRIFMTPYYFVDSNDASTCRLKYERKGNYAEDFLGREIELFESPRHFKRAPDAMPLIGTNCLNFVMSVAQHVAGIPLTQISSSLRDTHHVSMLEQLVDGKVGGNQPEYQKDYDVAMERLPGGTPVLYLNAPWRCARFPDCLKDLCYDGTPVMEQLATSRHPLYDRSLSHAAMRG